MNNIRSKISRFLDWFFVEKIQYPLMLMFAFWVCYLVFRLVLLPEIAVRKAKNLNNIQSSCLYLISEHYSKQGIKKVVEINGKIYHTDGSTLNLGYLYGQEQQFPFYYKDKKYYGGSLFWDKIATQTNTCYEIQYISILNLIGIDFIYLYDFEVPKKFQSDNFKSIQIRKAN